MKVGEKIRMLRKNLGYSQQHLAEMCGLRDKTAISKIELGKNSINIDLLQKIAEALEVDTTFFVEFKRKSIDISKYKEYEEYLPYLAQASEETIRNIRYMLKMPELKKGNCVSGQEKVV